MAVLTTQQREAAARYLARRLYGDKGQVANCALDNLIAAVGDVDDALEANLTTLNNAIPEPAKSIMTAADKAELFSVVMLGKTGVMG